MYYEEFGLRADPFRLRGSETLFLSATHLQGLAALEWGFREPSGLTLIAGEVGTGKTTLIHALLARHFGGFRIVELRTPPLSPEEMLLVTVMKLGLHPVGKDRVALLHALETFLADPSLTDSVVMIFDEAQGLSDEVLEEVRLLSNQRPRRRNALQIILVGQPELVQRLFAPKLRALDQRIGARALLRPLSCAEVYDYVNYLLHAQGARRRVFSRRALARVSDLSGGLPRNINNLCHTSMLLAYSEGQNLIKARHVDAAKRENGSMPAVAGTDGYGVDTSHRRAKRLVIAGIVGGLSVLAASVLAFRVASGNGWLGAWISKGHSALQHEARSVGELSSVLAGRMDLRETKGSSGSAGLQTPGAGGSEFSGPLPQPPPKDGAVPLAPEPGSADTHLPQIVHATSVPAQTPPVQTPPAQTAHSPSSNPGRARSLRYEVRRAEASLRAGRYTNASYHLKRALALAPNNQRVRHLLRVARERQSERMFGVWLKMTPRQVILMKERRQPPLKTMTSLLTSPKLPYRPKTKNDICA